MIKKLSTEPYKGVRDFYPKDQAVQNYIFNVWKKVCERFGYEEYGASILEPTELYSSKTSDEIVSEQTYTFIDRGKRSVTLRPEMTPSVARLVAGRKRELSFPLRWYSIPNCFRYERPQRGRVREFWQLNADIFGVPGIEAEVEIIALAHALMKEFGAKNEDFEIRINDRGLVKESLMTRMSELEAEEELRKIDKGISKESGSDTLRPESSISKVIEELSKRGVQNIRYDRTLVRGFQYYTGTVFEVYDTNDKNPRSIFGGGRYNSLTEMFGEGSVPAVGFGKGDVIIRDFLETHGLMPNLRSSTSVFICPLSYEYRDSANKLADFLRSQNISCAVYYGDKKIGDQVKIANKKNIPCIIAVGKEELISGRYTLKKLSTGEEFSGTEDFIASRLISS
jgi:histidyl-tRNA synthetase